MTSSTSPGRQGLAATVLLYAVARLAVVAVVAGLLLLVGVPLAVALLVGFVVALPLSMVLFRGLRTRLDAALADAGRRRSVERAALRARLRGDETTGGSDDGNEDQPDRGEGRPREQE